jgi:hypothetical protein
VPDEKPRRRGEGEVTQWPRGLVAYTPTRTPEASPDPEEDRTGNRIRLAARLLGLLQSEGRDVRADLEELQAVELAYREGRRAEASRRVDGLLGRLEPSPDRANRGPTP